jgi:hypothetical protein
LKRLICLPSRYIAGAAPGATGDEEVPEIVHADFKTTADDAEWQG